MAAEKFARKGLEMRVFFYLVGAGVVTIVGVAAYYGWLVLRGFSDLMNIPWKR